MKISIIIPTYNEEKLIQNCLESLMRQSHRDLEVIVVDDGSRDATIQEVKDSAVEVKLLEQKHKGPGSARNLGAKYATGEILVFVDADMTFAQDFIANLVKPIADGKAIGTFSKEEYLGNKNNLWAVCWNLNRGLPKDRMHPNDYPDKQKVFRAILKKEFDKVGGFDEKAGYSDDWSLSEKLGVEAVSSPGAVFYHNNPDSLGDVFIQSRWMAKRQYKLGLIGYSYTILIRSFPVSVVLGALGAIRFMLPAFLIFRIVSDFGQFVGVLEYLNGKVSK